jgi:hypothetical protein
MSRLPFVLSTLHLQASVYCGYYVPAKAKFLAVVTGEPQFYFLKAQTQVASRDGHSPNPPFWDRLPLDMTHFDPLGETEPENTVYTLTVRCPQRPPPKWLPSFMTRVPVIHPNTGAAYTIKPDDTNVNLDCFERKHLADMSTKIIKIKRSLFPLDMRCPHVRNSTTCDRGCYVLEKGGDISRQWCNKKRGCEGHVYCGRVKKDEQGNSCFGKKGVRMVCIEQ